MKKYLWMVAALVMVFAMSSCKSKESAYKKAYEKAKAQQTEEAVVGNQAILTIERMNFNKGFFGTNGITKESGFTTPDINEALVKETAFEHCRNKYILTDSSKFGETSAVTFGNISDATIITDSKPIGLYVKLANIITV